MDKEERRTLQFFEIFFAKIFTRLKHLGFQLSVNFKNVFQQLRFNVNIVDAVDIRQRYADQYGIPVARENSCHAKDVCKH